MKALITRYLNEIVSIWVMLLMVVALVAAQAGGNVADAVDGATDVNLSAAISGPAD